MTVINARNIARGALTALSAAIVKLGSTVLIAKFHVLHTAKAKHVIKFWDIVHKVALTDIITMGMSVTNVLTNV